MFIVFAIVGMMLIDEYGQSRMGGTNSAQNAAQ